MTMPAYNPIRMRMVEASSFQNSIFLYDIGSPFSKTITIGEPTASIRKQEEAGMMNMKRAFMMVQAYPTFFAVLYSGDSLSEPSGATPVIQFIDWEGCPLLEARLSVQGTSFDIDVAGKILYVADQKQEKIFRFEIADLLDEIPGSVS